jgi:iron complex outermembrane receptor protein
VPNQSKSAHSLVLAPRRSALATACYLALMSATGSAYAQETQTEPTTPETQADQASTTEQPATAPQTAEEVDTLGTVHVTGIRRSIMSSVNTKNSSDSIVEVVSSEDLGKLPDVSIAESLARLPGLAAQRVDGRAQVIAIRGMSPDFAATLLNGREQVSTGDNRGVEFDQYPSELLDSAVVYKTPDATVIGQGLSGTVDLRTVRPLSFREPRFTANLRGENNSLGEQNYDGSANGYRVSASYIDQFRDNTIGLAIGVARLDSPFQEQHHKTWWWANTDAWGAPAIPGKPLNAVFWQGAEAWLRSRDQVRDGVMGVLEFKPNDELHSTLDFYYSKFKQEETTRGLMWDQSPDWGSPCTRCITVSDPVLDDLDGFPVVVGGTVGGVRPIVRNDFNDRDDTLYSFGWKNEYNISESWKASTDLYYSRAKRSQTWLETYAGNASTDSIGFDVPVGSPDFPTYTPGLDYADPNTIVLSDPAGWGREGRMENTRQEDQITGIRLELNKSFDAGPFTGLDFGFAGTRRIKDKDAEVYFAQLKNGASSQLVESDLLGSPTDLDFVGIPGSLAYDVLGAIDRYYDLVLTLDGNDLRKDFTVTEQVETAYAKLNIDTDLTDSIRLRGNVGVQFVRTDQSSEAFALQGATVLGTFTRGTTYDDVLPSLNLVADFGSGWIVRLGAAKTLARPRIDDLRASAEASVCETGSTTCVPGTWSGNGGNPLLEPWRATSGDLSLEKYFGDASYVALALFYKDLESYIFNQTIPDYDFSNFINVTDTVPISDFGNFTAPANGGGGYMRGVELSTALEGSLFSNALEGFGLLFNASYTETSIDPDPLDDERNRAGLPGLSKIVGNLTAYYEKNGFSARVSQRYRSEFQGEITSLFAARSYTAILPENPIDFQIGYEFQPGSSMAGWGLLFQVNNVTNEPYRTVQRSDFGDGGDFHTTPLEYNEYGRQYLLGITFKM